MRGGRLGRLWQIHRIVHRYGLREFLESAYRAVASRAKWDCEALDIPAGRPGKPYDVAAHRRG